VVSHDSAYVNNLARCNLTAAVAAATRLAQLAPDAMAALTERIGLGETELADMAKAAERIRTMRGDDGLFEQCRGFFSLADAARHQAQAKTHPHLTQTVKQADVLMMIMMLREEFSDEALRVNWDYYDPRTVHHSSLSHGCHGILAAEMGMMDVAQKYVGQSLGMDLADEMNNTALGAHMAANGMNWHAVVRGYGGARATRDRLLVAPHVPEGWRRLQYKLLWRGSRVVVDIGPETATVTNEPDATAPLALRLVGRDIDLAPGESAKAAR
jgi:trehalose/maltose hydrolase-like predicted phosphorylase